MFKDKNILPHFPKLRVVIRTQLVPPSNDKIRDEILKRGSEQAQVIQKYFPRSTTEVSHIPTLTDSKKLSKFDWRAFQNLTINLQNYPEKRSFEGSIIDGVTLRQLAEKIVEAMNSDDLWKDFGDVYASLERDICRRSYQKHIKPVLRQTSEEIANQMIDAFDEFKKECFLEDEITNAKEELKVTLNEKREREDEERRRQEDEDRKTWRGSFWIWALTLFAGAAVIFICFVCCCCRR